MKEDKTDDLLNELRDIERKLIQYADDKESSYERFYTDLEMVKNVCDFLKFKNIDHECLNLCDDLVQLTISWGSDS